MFSTFNRNPFPVAQAPRPQVGQEYSPQRMQPTQQKKPQSEYSPLHNEQYCAFNPTSRKLLSQTDIFSQNLDKSQLRFTALVAKQVRSDYSQAMQQHQSSKQQLDQVCPNLVK
jgi:hypothetical protein